MSDKPNAIVMINDSPSSLVFIRICIVALQCIGPCSLAWTVWLALNVIINKKAIGSLHLPGLQAYVVAEAVFYLFFLWFRRHLQREAVHPPLSTREERQALAQKVRGEIHDPDRFLSGWFRGADPEDIGRDDLRSFLNWCFWEGRATKADAEEMESYVNLVEDITGHQFQESKGGAHALRLTLDPIEMDARSLLWYAIVMLMDHVTSARFWYSGFSYRRTGFIGPWTFPPRPGTLFAGGRSPAKSLSYWVRPHTSKTRLPVLFIHGIGIGLDPYVELLSGINASNPADESVGVLVLEILPISSRITHPILRREAFIQQITQILDLHGYDKFVLASHSYGSVFSTYMLTDDDLTSRISATILIDPVTILLHMPDVAFNFTVRKPRTANEWQLWYFASKDPGVAHTLGRHFFWFENCLWRQRINQLVQGGMRITVSLASRDLIVDTKAVARYLFNEEVPDPDLIDLHGHQHMELETQHQEDGLEPWENRTWRGKGLDLLWNVDLDHAQVFDDAPARAKLVRIINEYSQPCEDGA